MQNQEITITVPLATEIDPLFALTLNEHIAELFRCWNENITENDIRVDVRTITGLASPAPVAQQA